MSARNIQQPTVTHDDGPLGGEIFAHPAYGQISASRVSGNAVLYGSDFYHQNAVRICINTSTLRRSLSNDWPYVGRELIEVELSEAQWAHFVSCMNTHEGSMCTLRYVAGEQIPGLPAPQDKRGQFASEVAENIREAHARLREAQALLAESGLSKAKQQAIAGKLSAAISEIGANTQFVSDQFGEHMEKTVQAAKIEVNAYAENALRAAGIKQLGGVAPLAIGGEES